MKTEPNVRGLCALCTFSAWALVAQIAAAQFCEPAWSEEFEAIDLRGGRVIKEVDLGSGPALIAAGRFSRLPGAPNFISFENGHWQPLEPDPRVPGIPQVADFEVFDDGGGPSLFAVGSGSHAISYVRRWDGQRWELVGTAFGTISAAAAFDDGSGTALYIGGQFNDIDGVSVSSLARWRNGAWEPVGEFDSGVGVRITAISVADDGGGEALYVSGMFSSVDGISASGIVALEGAGGGWRPLGTGLQRPGSLVGYASSIVTHDDGSGPAVYVGGSFSTAGGVASPNVARLQHGEWSAIGEGLDGFVQSLRFYAPSGAERLFAGGSFEGGLASWDGQHWTVAGSPGSGWAEPGGVNAPVNDMEVATVDGRQVLIMLGGFLSVGASIMPGNAQWDGYAFESTPATGVIGSHVSLLKTEDFLGQEHLYISGSMQALSGQLFRSGRWDGVNLEELYPGSAYRDVVAHHDGRVPGLFMPLVSSVTLGSSSQLRIVRFTPTGWLRAGSAPLSTESMVRFRPTGGATFLFASDSRSSGGVHFWHDNRWYSFATGGEVHALAVYDDGSGEALYAGGNFTSLGGVEASHIARWRAGVWEEMGGGFGPAGTSGVVPVRKMKVIDDSVLGTGGGSALYVVGGFETAGGTLSRGIARWDGAWSPVGGGVASGSVNDVALFDDGNGAAIYAGGTFELGSGPRYLARWDGQEWSSVGEGVDDQVRALAVWDDGRGPALWIGGDFHHAGGLPAARLTRYIACEPCYANCDGSTTEPILTVDDFTCFIDQFAQALQLPIEEQITHYANCDGATEPPILTVNDFTCFIDAFAAGCP